MDNRQIRIFISSTFQDMQVERNYLIEKVFPKLRLEASKREVSIVPLDLRWGITEEESKNGKVLEICLQEITNSHPFFIGLIGERYGWCPTIDEYEKNELLQERYNWIKQDIENGLSVTEIEMQYGALRSKEKINAFFYIKGNNNNKSERLENLKEQIKNNKHDYPLYYYNSPEELGKQVEKDFINLLNSLYPEKSLTEQEKRKIIQKSYLRYHYENYIPNDEYYKTLDIFLEQKEQVLIITAETGTGKTALIANWIANRKIEQKYNIIHILANTDSTTTDYRQIFERICYEIDSLYQLGYSTPPKSGGVPKSMLWDYKGYNNVFEEISSQIPSNRPLLIILDGLNKIDNKENSTDWFPKKINKNIKLLLSSTPNDSNLEVLQHFAHHVFSISSLSNDTRIQFIKQYLNSYGKKLNITQEKRILNHPLYSNTLLLRLFVNELINFGEYEKLDQFIDYYLQANNAKEFFLLLFERYEGIFGKLFIKNILSLLAFSYKGLSEHAIIEITKTTQLRWSQFYCSFYYNLINVNNLLTIADNTLKNIIVSNYKSNEKETRTQIITYLEKQETIESVEELTFQYKELDEFNKLHEHLLHYDIFKYLHTNNRDLLYNCWKTLWEIDKYKFSIEPYIDILSNIQEEDIWGQKKRPIETFIVIGDFLLYQCKEHLLAQKFYEQAIVLQNKENEYDIDIRAQIYSKLANICEYSSLHDKALEYYNLSNEMLITESDKDYHSIALNNMSIAGILFLKQNFNEALKYINQAFDFFQKCKVIESSTNALCFLLKGNILFRQNKNQESLDAYEIALANLDTIKNYDSKMIADIHVQIAELYNYYKREPDAAIEHYVEAISIYSTILHDKKDDIQLAQLCFKTGLLFYSQDIYDEALVYLEESLSLQENNNENEDKAYCLYFAGHTHANLSSYNKAIEYLEHCLNIRQKLLGKTHNDVAVCYENIASILIESEEEKKAINYLDEALFIHFQNKSTDNIINIYEIKASCYENIGKLKKAILCNYLAETIRNKEILSFWQKVVLLLKTLRKIIYK